MIDDRLHQRLTKEEVDTAAWAIVHGHKAHFPKLLRKDDAARIYNRAKEIRKELETDES